MRFLLLFYHSYSHHFNYLNIEGPVFNQIWYSVKIYDEFSEIERRNAGFMIKQVTSRVIKAPIKCIYLQLSSN